MKILSFYNTAVQLEKGDLIAIMDGIKKLWIRTGNKVYTCEWRDKLNLEGRLYVNSAGLYSQDPDFKKLPWVEYKPVKKN